MKVTVKAWEETVNIPTYGVGEPNKNPMFLDKRIYQGSSGKVYPHPVIDKIEDKKELKSYRLVYLENEFVQIVIMPELGGRIYRALDKTNQYDFVYYNQVIKPALVGLTGPWISGGIEFNWPQHHRPNTYGPVDYRIVENSDGSQTVWVNEIDRMYGTKGMAGFTLYPGKAYLEIEGQLYNRTSEPQTFLWWANPAVSVNVNTQSVFPPDVNAVFDHGKRDVSNFPIATGTYYKMDYSLGVDISKYKNIPVPTSYMAYHSDYNFVGGYDHGKKAGILHVANHHISPGKKQWTWGCGDFGKAWDRNLTDEDGPYIELMTGVYTDNQPDFTWLHPHEEKTFKQYFMPYKDIGVVKNATIDAAINLEISRENCVRIQAYVTARFNNVTIQLTGRDGVYFVESVDLSPTISFSVEVPIKTGELAHHLIVKVISSKGDLLVDYQPNKPRKEEMPEPAKEIGQPKDLKNTEALLLAAKHLEQYRHATYNPDDYYREGLQRDPEDSRLNSGYGLLLMKRGLFSESEGYFRRAIESITRHNPNPEDTEPFYYLGRCLKYQGRLEEAFAAFYKSVWSATWQDNGYFALAQIATESGKFPEALELVDRALTRNTRNYKARNLKVALLRHLEKETLAEKMAKETLTEDISDFGARYELYLLAKKANNHEQATVILEDLTTFMRNDVHNFIALAQDYADCGLFQESLNVLERIAANPDTQYPMVPYYTGYLYAKCGKTEEALKSFEKASQTSSDYCFPNSLNDYIVLTKVVSINRQDAKAYYYLGNLLYDKKRVKEATDYWEKSVQLDSSFATVHRNLALAYYNHSKDLNKAKSSLEKAFELNNNDARVLYELDQLYKKMNLAPQKRLDFLDNFLTLVYKRDDLFVEYVTLKNTLQHFEKALELLQYRFFHPWEGGEGKVTSQYILAKVEVAKTYLKETAYERAMKELEEALVFPENLGEGKLAGAQENNIYYYLGCVFEATNNAERARLCFEKAAMGLEEPTSAMFYNDQPPEMIYYQGLAHLKLGQKKEANARFNKLVEYGEKHLYDNVKIDYFAVSLPDFLVFEEDLNKKNRIHCHFMMGLGALGLNDRKKALNHFYAVKELDLNHQGVMIHNVEGGPMHV
ncbi:DUF5107 domain-containing protein [Bacillus solitudinis]|uniref:DUF5107 domain-containing protein n=1 Tax=Bacillus solitudinis TaxID=2014074 RepID=UPI000C243CE5|nr:DUF5107 domain-containing protein [Bacillus solitudinis]